MFERFTERARNVMPLAQEEAQRLGHNYIGTEHILLGLVGESEGVADSVLGNLGARPDEIRCEVVRMFSGEPGRRLESESQDTGPSEPAQNRLLFRGKVTSLRITARFDGQPRTLLVDPDYTYAVPDTADATRALNHDDLLTGVAEILEAQKIRTVETGIWRAGEYVLENFPAVTEITVGATEQRVLEDHAVSGFTITRTFRR